MSNFSSFYNIETLHKQIHLLGSELCKQFRQNNKQEINNKLTEIYKLRDKLLLKLKDLLVESQYNT